MIALSDRYYMEQEFYSIKEVAIIFAVHEITIRRALKKGFIVGIRVGEGKRSPYRISRKMLDLIHESLIKSLASKAKG
jgi:hypothetical protein